MAGITDELKNSLKNTLNRQERQVSTSVVGSLDNTVTATINNFTSSTLSGLLGNDSPNKKKTVVSTDKKSQCKYQVAHFVIMKDDERIELDHSNILSIEYMNDYEFNIMALLKVSLRIDIRRKIWMLKNKRDILVKFELNKIGMDTDNEKYVTSPEKVWNEEFAMYFNDEDESADIGVMESRINLNEGGEFKSGDIQGENYFESQNTLDVYLVLPELLKASRYSFNKVYTKTTLQNMVGHMLTESGHKHVLMSKFENNEIYQELLLPINPLYKNLIYLDQYYGMYKKGAIIYYDVDILYILNANGKLTAKRQDEWTETTFLISRIADSTPGNGMVRKEGESIFYPTISDSDVNPQNFSVSKNAGIGGAAKIVVTDTTDVELHEADQAITNQRNENVTFIKDKNKFTGDVIKARMEENDCILYISGNNLDIKAFTPNKICKVVFDETSKHEKYGKSTYRMAYAYHFLKLESEGYMSSSHRTILKKTASDKDPEKSTNSLGSISSSSILNGGGIKGILNNIEGAVKGEIGKFENRLNSTVNNSENKLRRDVNSVINKEINTAGNTITSGVTSSISNTSVKKNSNNTIINKMSQVIGANVDIYKNNMRNNF